MSTLITLTLFIGGSLVLYVIVHRLRVRHARGVARSMAAHPAGKGRPASV